MKNKTQDFNIGFLDPSFLLLFWQYKQGDVLAILPGKSTANGDSSMPKMIVSYINLSKTTWSEFDDEINWRFEYYNLILT